MNECEREGERERERRKQRKNTEKVVTKSWKHRKRRRVRESDLKTPELNSDELREGERTTNGG